MDWSSLLSALLGGALALAGQGLQGRTSRRTELRHRSELAAVAVRDLAQQIGSLFRRHTDKHGSLDVEDEKARLSLVAKLRGEALLIGDSGVRTTLLEAGGVLNDSFAVQQFHGTSEVTVNTQVCGWLETSIGSYLRRESQPATPTFMTDYRAAIDRAYETWAEQYEETRRLE